MAILDDSDLLGDRLRAAITEGEGYPWPRPEARVRIMIAVGKLRRMSASEIAWLVLRRLKPIVSTRLSRLINRLTGLSGV